MAFAVIAAQSETPDTSSGSITVAMPAGISAGDLLLVLCAQDVSGTITQSGGSDWTKLEQTNNSTICGLAIFAKIAAGGDTLTLTSTNSQDAAAGAFRITGHGVSDVSTDITLGTAATGSSATPDPPNCNPGTAKDFLWIAVNASDDDDDTTPFGPTNYTEVMQLQSANSTSSCLLQVASRELNASAENPGTFALAATEEWVAQTLAIPPSAVQEAANTFSGASAATFDAAITTEHALPLSGSAAVTLSGSLTTEHALLLSSSAAASFEAAFTYTSDVPFTGSAAIAFSGDITKEGAITLSASAAFTTESQASFQAGLALTASATAGDGATATLPADLALSGAAGASLVGALSVDGALALPCTAALLGASGLTLEGALVCSGSAAASFGGELSSPAIQVALDLGANAACTFGATQVCNGLLTLAASAGLNTGALVRVFPAIVLSSIASLTFAIDVALPTGPYNRMSVTIVPINRRFVNAS